MEDIENLQVDNFLVGPYVLIGGMLIIGLIMARIIVYIFFKYLTRAGIEEDKAKHKKSAKALRLPLNVLFISLTMYISERIFPLHPDIRLMITHLLEAVLTLTFYMLAYQATGIFLVRKILSAIGVEKSTDFESLLVAVFKTIVAILGLLTLLQIFNVNITAILGGLTILSTGIAFAAKDTLQQFIGAMSLYIEGRFKIGDMIKTSSVEGFVEYVGLRSTMIRQLDKALVSIPSDHLANATLINYSKRTFWQLKWDLGLRHDTKRSQLDNILRRMLEWVKNDKDMETNPENVITVIRVSDFQHGISIFTCIFARANDFVDYMRIREKVIFEFLKIVEEEGAQLAHPTHNLHIESHSNHHNPIPVNVYDPYQKTEKTTNKISKK